MYVWWQIVYRDLIDWLKIIYLDTVQELQKNARIFDYFFKFVKLMMYELGRLSRLADSDAAQDRQIYCIFQ